MGSCTQHPPTSNTKTTTKKMGTRVYCRNLNKPRSQVQSPGKKVYGLTKILTFEQERVFLVLCEWCLKICFKKCCPEGNQHRAVWPGKPGWHHLSQLQNASALFIGCTNRELSLKIHSCHTMHTWKSKHSSRRQLIGLRLMPWIVFTFLFPRKWITARQAKEKVCFLLAFPLMRKHKALLYAATCFVVVDIMTSHLAGKSKVQTGARLSTTDLLCHGR